MEKSLEERTHFWHYFQAGVETQRISLSIVWVYTVLQIGNLSVLASG